MTYIPADKTPFRIHAYDGSSEEMACLINRVWQKNYGGKIVLPKWSAAQFRWQFLTSRSGVRTRVFAATRDGRLVGICPVEILEGHWAGQSVSYSFSSWLTVDPTGSSGRIATHLIDAMFAWAREQGAFGALGWVNGAHVKAKGSRFWRLKCPDASYFTNPRLWVRNFSAYAPKANQACHAVKPYASSDLSDCTALLNQRAQSAPFGMIWTNERMHHQLCFEDVPQSFVYREGSKPKGVISYHLNQLHGGSGKLAMIDVFHTGDLAPDKRDLFTEAVFDRMQASGATMAMVLGPPVNKTDALRAAGFGPSFSAYSAMFVPLADPPVPTANAKPYLLFR